MEKTSRHDDEPEEEFSVSPIPAAPDGGIDAGVAAGMIGQPVTVPERHPDNFICLRGPCRHYWYLVTMAQEGNPEETWDHLGIKQPKQHHHSCLNNPGYETSFADDNAYECSRWEPMLAIELVQIGNRRSQYYDLHPEHAPLDASNRKSLPWWKRLLVAIFPRWVFKTTAPRYLTDDEENTDG